MKIIKPNNIKVESDVQIRKSLLNVRESVTGLIKIDDQYVQYVKCERDDESLVRCDIHPFVEAVHLAYSYHLPLVISPDMIWYLISSGLALHINKHAEELRSKFVDHEDKRLIEIIRDDFVLDKSASNPWHEVVDEFAFKLAELTKNDAADLIVASFSTTTKTSRVVSQLVLMDAMQKYFDYQLLTRCGVPEIRISGAKEDWQKIQSKVQRMVSIMPELEAWTQNGLNEILQNFVDVFDEKINSNFWNQIYKHSSGSGGPFISGWILGLFPYLDQGKENDYVWKMKWNEIQSRHTNVTTNSFNYHMNQVPFKWIYLGSTIDMKFVGGLMGIVVEKDQALMPVFGYAIVEDKIKQNNNKKEFF